jgi:hypothetical protein
MSPLNSEAGIFGQSLVKREESVQQENEVVSTKPGTERRLLYDKEARESFQAFQEKLEAGPDSYVPPVFVEKTLEAIAALEPQEKVRVAHLVELYQKQRAYFAGEGDGLSFTGEDANAVYRLLSNTGPGYQEEIIVQGNVYSAEEWQLSPTEARAVELLTDNPPYVPTRILDVFQESWQQAQLDRLERLKVDGKEELTHEMGGFTVHEILVPAGEVDPEGSIPADIFIEGPAGTFNLEQLVPKGWTVKRVPPNRQSYSADPESKVVTYERLDNPVTFFALLHELGHANDGPEHWEAWEAAINRNEELKRKANKLPYEEMRAQVKAANIELNDISGSYERRADAWAVLKVRSLVEQGYVPAEVYPNDFIRGVLQAQLLGYTEPCIMEKGGYSSALRREVVVEE